MKLRQLAAVPALFLFLGGTEAPAQQIRFEPAILTPDTHVEYVNMARHHRRRHHRRRRTHHRTVTMLHQQPSSAGVA